MLDPLEKGLKTAQVDETLANYVLADSPLEHEVFKRTQFPRRVGRF